MKKKEDLKDQKFYNEKLIPFAKLLATNIEHGNGNLKITLEQEKVHELKKKLKDAELERDILKKSNRHFSKSGR